MDDRPHFIERGEAARTPEETRRRRSTAMIVFGVVSLVVGVRLAVEPVTLWLLFALLGVGLLVGGLVIRR